MSLMKKINKIKNSKKKKIYNKSNKKSNKLLSNLYSNKLIYLFLVRYKSISTHKLNSSNLHRLMVHFM